jgi:hypothetical protein
MARPIAPDLFIEVTSAAGVSYRWDANQPAGSRPFDLSFRTKIGDGFSDASLRLARRIDLDYADLDLGNAVVIRAADGSVVFEGYIAAMPRDLTDSHWIGVTVTGWMAAAKDKKFQEIFTDRDAGQWGDLPIERKATVLGASISIGDFSYGAGQGGLVAALPNQALGAQTLSEAWYQAPPGTTVGGIGYRGKTVSFPAGWSQVFSVTDARNASGASNITATLDDTLRVAAAPAARRYILHQTYSNGTAATPAAGASIQLSKLAVYGNTGLTTRTGDPLEPDGLSLSDIIRNIAQRFCPLLDTSGVEDNNYVVQHCAYRDLTYPYDAFVDLNKYALWHLGVWENRTLTFRPYDLSVYDWEIRTDDPGTTFSPQGPSIEDFFNGIQVAYTDPLTGVQDVLSPSTHAELVDASAGNSWNAHSRDHWTDIAISVPVFQGQALNIGGSALADKNRPKNPGTITVTGYIKDAAGNPQPVSKVRAGQTISVTNFPNDDPRLIVETDYNAETGENKLAIDKPFAVIEAYLARVDNALTGLGSR